MEHFIQYLHTQSPVLVYCALFGFAYLENIFPPSPSDVVMVLGGTFVGLGVINMPMALIFSTAGSTLGFITVYYLGKWFGVHIIDSGKLRFIPRDKIVIVERWFQKWGAWVIVVNRFLSGTRAVVSFFAGMSSIPASKAALLCTVSSLAWNFLLIYAGSVLGNNWRSISDYIDLYSYILSGILLAAILGWIWYRAVRKKRAEARTNA